MKKLLLFMVLLFLVLSCAFPVIPRYVPEIYDADTFKLDYFFQSKTLIEITVWVCDNVEYLADETDYWQSPEETLSSRIGDCEDKALLIMVLAYHKIRIKANIRIYYFEKINSGHAVVEHDGWIYDGTNGLHMTEEDYVLNFDAIEIDNFDFQRSMDGVYGYYYFTY